MTTFDRAGYEQDGSDRTTIRLHAEEKGWYLDRAEPSRDVFRHPDRDKIAVVVVFRIDTANRYQLRRSLHEASLESDVGSHSHAYVSAPQYRQGQLDYVLSWFQ
jgi:predicted RNA binding protein YcfA (HicA-like mRNA interferase family)